MNEWINIFEETPHKQGVYRVWRWDYNRWREDHLLWKGASGFQPLNHGQHGTWDIDMDVAFWLKCDIPPIPKQQAETMLLEHMSVFGAEEELISVIDGRFKTLMSHQRGHRDVVLTGVSDVDRKVLCDKFSCNSILKAVHPYAIKHTK